MDTATPGGYDRTSYVLVVDDDNTLLKFFKIHLNKFFSRVIVVKNAKEAIEAIREGGIDLVITDIRMPRMDGFQLLKKIRAFDASIPVVLISGAMLDDEQIKECESHTDGFLRKPFSVEELHDTICRGVERREVLKKLGALVNDNKILLQVLKGAKKIERAVTEEHTEEAVKLWEMLKAG